MSKHQRMVREFHQALGHPAPLKHDKTNAFKGVRRNLRYELIKEEVEELRQAYSNHDPIETIDALCDILYTTYGAAVEMGIDLDPYFEEVHASNMAKAQGWPDGKPHFREDGKTLKPPNWEPPNIAGIYNADEQTESEP